MAINYSVSPITRIRCRMRPSFEPQNWVRRSPPPSTVVNFDVAPVYVEILCTYCIVVVEFSLMSWLVQVNLFGADIAPPVLHPAMLSAPLAWTFFPSSRCIADGSCKRSAAISGLSWIASTLRLPCRQPSWGALFCSCFATMTMGCSFAHHGKNLRRL